MALPLLLQRRSRSAWSAPIQQRRRVRRVETSASVRMPSASVTSFFFPESGTTPCVQRSCERAPRSRERRRPRAVDKGSVCTRAEVTRSSNFSFCIDSIASINQVPIRHRLERGHPQNLEDRSHFTAPTRQWLTRPRWQRCQVCLCVCVCVCVCVRACVCGDFVRCEGNEGDWDRRGLCVSAPNWQAHDS
jgi:hypothetical protein